MKNVFQALNMTSFVVCWSSGTDEIVLNTFGKMFCFIGTAPRFSDKNSPVQRVVHPFHFLKMFWQGKNHLTSLGWWVFLKVFDTMKLCSEVGSWKKNYSLFEICLMFPFQKEVHSSLKCTSPGIFWLSNIPSRLFFDPLQDATLSRSRLVCLVES